MPAAGFYPAELKIWTWEFEGLRSGTIENQPQDFSHSRVYLTLAGGPGATPPPRRTRAPPSLGLGLRPQPSLALLVLSWQASFTRGFAPRIHGTACLMYYVTGESRGEAGLWPAAPLWGYTAPFMGPCRPIKVRSTCMWPAAPLRYRVSGLFVPQTVLS